MTDTECSYCGAINGGHTLACSALAQDAAEGDPYLRKTGWERHQAPCRSSHKQCAGAAASGRAQRAPDEGREQDNQ